MESSIARLERVFSEIFGVEDFEETLSLSEILDEWQQLVGLVSGFSEGHFVTLCCFRGHDLKFLVKSEAFSREYERVDAEDRLAGTYSEAIFKTGERLKIEDGRAHSQWQQSAAVQAGRLSFLGLPIRNPDGSLFGALNIHGDQASHFSPEIEKLLERLCKVVETHLQVAAQAADLLRCRDEILQLREMLPTICGQCKKVSNEEGWEQLESYLRRDLGAVLTHGVCPECSSAFLDEV